LHKLNLRWCIIWTDAEIDCAESGWA